MKRVSWMLKNVWKSEQAETLAELLIAVLITALGLLLFASALMAGRGMITKSDAQFQLYYEERNALDQGLYENPAILVLEWDGKKTALGSCPFEAEAGHYPIRLFSEKETDARLYRYRRGEYEE